MKRINIRHWFPHLIAVLIFIALSVAYFSPVVFDNKDLPQGDVASAQAWGKDIRDHYEKTGEYAYWSNTMFGGMPANYTYAPPMTNIFKDLSIILRLNLPGLHVGIVFLYLIGFYILLMAL
ncbi:MAG: hypothetical protein RB294_04590, partial [Bacteroidales bacterium]|nr:hypothetical protein [Bacteroidales bacterium]